MKRWRRKLRAAREAARGGDWQRCSTLYADVARDAAQAGDREVAQQCWSQAGDALRREDRPAAAAKALRQALDLLDPGDPAAASRRGAAAAELCGVLVDAGQLVGARDLARQELARTASQGGRTLLLDTLAGALLALGEVSEAEGLIEELREVAPPGARVAIAFREAALHRLAGRLSLADGLLTQVQEQLEGVEAAVGARAAASSERAEMLLLRGQPELAQEGFQAAREGWARAGRRAGVFRAEAAEVRCQVAQGQRPLATNLREPIAYAESRGLPLLEAELRMARGMARARAGVTGVDDDFDRGIALAQEAGARLLEGRLRAQRRGVGILRDDLERTRWCLQPDAPWSRLLA